MVSNANGVNDEHPYPVVHCMTLLNYTTLPLSLRLRMCAITRYLTQDITKNNVPYSTPGSLSTQPTIDLT